MGLDSSKDITSSSWSPFEGLELHGENKGRDDLWGPWKEEATLGSKIRKGRLTTRFLLEKYLNLQDCGSSRGIVETWQTLEFQIQMINKLLETKQMGKSNLQTINLKWKFDRLWTIRLKWMADALLGLEK
jgi:hypothetical protein